MPTHAKTLGKMGEDLAVDFLKKRGYTIRDRNFSCLLGEIDIVIEDSGTLAFVEVKSRTSALFGRPEEAVNYDKRRRLTRLALWYINKNKCAGLGVRFDVISVMFDNVGQQATIELIKNAF